MRKLYWLILILVVISIAYVAASKAFPIVDEWAVANILTPIYNGGAYIYTGIVTNPTWVSYIAPNAWWICGVGGMIFGAVLVYYNLAKKLQAKIKQPTIAVEMQREIPTSTPQPIPKQTVEEKPATEKEIVAEA